MDTRVHSPSGLPPFTGRVGNEEGRSGVRSCPLHKMRVALCVEPSMGQTSAADKCRLMCWGMLGPGHWLEGRWEGWGEDWPLKKVTLLCEALGECGDSPSGRGTGASW